MSGDTKVLKVLVLGDSSKAQKAVRDVGHSAKAAEKETGGLKNLLKSGLAIGGAFEVGEFFKESIKGAVDAAKVTKVLNNQIKNLGPAGREAFEGAAEFADKLSEKIGVDDDDIKKVQAKLASFPDAFKKGSDGADGMQRSVKAAFDLQAIGIGEASGNIIAIGKAMNDPVKGMTALNKSGVSFNATQKEAIKYAAQHGQLQKAQQILLKGIESNAKGAAEAAVNPMQKMHVALDKAGKDIGALILPRLEQFATLVSEKILPKIEEVAKQIGPKISAGLDVIGTGMQKLFDLLSNPVVQTFVVGILTLVAAMKVYNMVTEIVTAVTEAWNTALEANPIGLIVVAIIALAASLYYAYTHFTGFRKVVDTVWAAIKTVTMAAVKWFKAYVWPNLAIAFKAIAAIAKALWPVIKAVFSVIMAILRVFIRFLIAYVWPFVKFVFTLIIGMVKALLVIFSTVFKAIALTVLTVVNWFKNTAWPALRDGFNGVKTWVTDLWHKFTSAFDLIKSKVETVLDACKKAFSNAKDAIGTVWSKLQDVAKAPVKFVIVTVYNNGIRKFWNAIADKIGMKNAELPYLQTTGLAKGGGVKGHPSIVGDWVPLFGQAGEYMLNRKQVAKAGGWRGVESIFGKAGRDGASGGHYAGGGILGGIANAGSWLVGKGTDLVKGSLLKVAAPVINTIKAAIGEIPGTGPIADAIRKMPTLELDKLLAFIKPKDVAPDVGSWNGTIAPGVIGKMQQWALGQRGKTYLWDAVGPAHYDCSGMVGNLWAMATGNPMYRRYMSTADMGPGRHGMVSGPGQFTVYLSVAGGHTAANVGGLHVEAYGGNGTPNAIGRIGTRLSYYQQKLHLPGLAGGGLVPGLTERLASFVQRGWPEPPKGVAVPRNFHPLEWKGIREGLYDNGGWLMPGTTLAHNNTGRPERVLNGDEASVQVHVTVQGNVTTEKDLAESIATAVRDAINRKAQRNGGKNGLI